MKVRICFRTIGLHLLLILVVLVFVVVGLFFWLAHYTRHGKATGVPDVCGLYYTDADRTLSQVGMYSIVIDSVYRLNEPGGVVFDQVPRAGSMVKRGRTIYLTINALNPREVVLPDLRNLSYRQAQAIVHGLGLPAPRIFHENSEYKNLVLDVFVDGVPVETGERLPVTTELTFVVGNGTYAPTRKIILPKDSLETDSVEELFILPGI
ncbi:MAG: PASTA domain-containing protein [Porphyromonadaceae bacterium]|nr:PASTA domain-containing protein [Porphyromonadaceae bacterium]